MKKTSHFLFKAMSRRIALGFIVAMVLIALGFIMSFYSYRQYGEDTERVRHTYEVVGSLEHLLSLVKDVETGSRGYVITNDPTYLAPYTAAREQLPTQLKQLRLLTHDSAIQTRRTARLEELINNKLAATETRLNVAPTDKINGIKASAQGKRSMDALRQHVAMMIDTERSLMEVRNREVDRSFRSTLILIFMLSLLTFLALAISYRLLEQELIRRQRHEEQLQVYEAQLKEKIRQLEASNQELERFAFVASHDLQEPLRKIQSFANLVMARYSNLLNDESQLFMTKIMNSAERMSKLIKDLLNFSRISNHREDFAPVRLGDIVQRILDDQELRIKGLGVQVEVSKLPSIQAVASQMDHLFTNLISNALKFTRPGVQPLLRIQSRPIGEGEYPQLIPGQPYVEITVEDNGIGFDEKYVEHIFKVFQRLHGKSEFEGTGIGLAICKRVAVYHHGFITAHSQPGHGTTFIVVLPERQFDQDYDRSNPTEAYAYFAG